MLFNHLRSLCIYALLFCVIPSLTMAQLGTGNNEVVFRNNTGNLVPLTINPAGFIFNNELIYNTQVTNFDDPPELPYLQNGNIENFSADIPGTAAFGFESPWGSDAWQSTGDILAQMMLGFGKYTIAFYQTTFTLNLIDAAWYRDNNQVIKFLFELDAGALTLYVYRGGSVINSMTINGGEEITPWDYSGVPRGRDSYDYPPTSTTYFFNIDGTYSPYIPIPSTQVSDLILDVNTQVKNNVTLLSGKALRIYYYDDQVNKYSTTLTIDNLATLICENWPLIEFHSSDPGRAVLSFLGDGHAEIYHPLVLKGDGTIRHVNITWHSHFQIEDGNFFTFEHGGTFNFAFGTPQRNNIYINGVAAFNGLTNDYYFAGNINTIYVTKPGFTPLLKLNEGVVFNDVPNLEVWDSTLAKISGTQFHPCSLRFKTLSNVDLYGTLDAVHTIFSGHDTTKWGGILVGHNTSTLSLDTCIVRDIAISDSLHGSAIHFYGSNGKLFPNQVRYTIIYNDQIKNGFQTGDGIFLQPEYNPPVRSNVLVSNCCIYDKWWTGVANINSDVENLDSTTIYGNYQGVDCTSNATAGLYYDCIKTNKMRGVFGEFNSLITLFNGSGDVPPGYNVIKDNGPNPFPWVNGAQIVLENQASIYGGWVDPITQNLWYGRDNISHYLPWEKRMYVDNSYARMQLEWWGETPGSGCGIYGDLDNNQVTRFFYINPPNNPPYYTLDYRNAWCTFTRDCNPPCSLNNAPIAPVVVDNYLSNSIDNYSSANNVITNKVGIFKGALYSSLSDAFMQVREFIKKNDFTSAYQILTTLINSTLDHSIVSIVAHFAIHTEIEYSKKNKGSFQVSGNRLLSFLDSHISNASNNLIKAALIEAYCVSLLHFDDITKAETSIKVFRSTYPFSTYTTRTLWQLLMIEMEYRDTLEVNNVIDQMMKEGFSVNDLRLAYSMRSAFLRIKPKDLFVKGANTPKFSDRFPSTKNSVPTDMLMILNYPNPFNPSTVIEYNLPSSTHVTLKVYTLLGKEVTTLVDEDQKAGKHFVNFEVKRKSDILPSGMYIYTLTTLENQVTGKMNILK